MLKSTSDEDVNAAIAIWLEGWQYIEAWTYRINSDNIYEPDELKGSWVDPQGKAVAQLHDFIHDDKWFIKALLSIPGQVSWERLADGGRYVVPWYNVYYAAHGGERKFYMTAVGEHRFRVCIAILYYQTSPVGDGA